MNQQNIDILHREAQRLVVIQTELLDTMMEESGVISESNPNEPQTFDRTSTPKHIEVLKGEQTKLERLEMVLAVVGTMKAGKSTVINAIVGTEVLPNRNRPMTALPTLIRHTPGQLEPVLKFENYKPIHGLMDILRQALDDPGNAGMVRSLRVDDDMQALIDSLRNAQKPQRLYEGADAIFEFLKELNDLVRLSKELGVAFPFEDYDEIHELPVIEVEFVHLRESEQTSGHLTLLDTPGPNESGQPHLRKMLKEQLAKASAVLAILDFTQLKSDADAQVRRDLFDIADVAENRLFVLINKFDQKDRHGDREEAVKAYVAHTLMEGRVQPGSIFPVSARWGYLANRARHELTLHKELPDPSEHPWVTDFGQEAFGRRYETKLGDPEAIRSGANDLWKDSLFDAPLERIIRTTHERAAIFAIDAAAAKLVDLAKNIDNFLAVRETAFTKSAKELQTQITALQRDMDRIAVSEAQVNQGVKEALKDMTEETKKILDDVKQKVDAAIAEYFKKGKRFEKVSAERRRKEQEEQKAKREQARERLSNFLYNLGSEQKPPDDTTSSSGSEQSSSEDELDFDPADPVMKFDDPEKAREYLNYINIKVTDIYKDAEKDLKSKMDETVTAFQAHFETLISQEAQQIIDGMQKRLTDDGFNLHLTMPNTSKLMLQFTGSELLDDVMEEKVRKEVGVRETDGFFGGLARFLGGWFGGYEDYTEDVKYTEIDNREVEKASNKALEEAFGNLDISIKDHIKGPLHERIDAFFQEFKQTVEQIRGDLLQSMRDQQTSQAEQKALMKRINKLHKKLPGILDDSRAVKDDIQPLLGAAAD